MAALDFFETVTVEYGNEGNGAALDSDDEGIVIPRSSLQLTDAQLHEYVRQ